MKNVPWHICKALCKQMKVAITKHLQFRTLKLQLGIFQFLRSYDASHDMISWYQHNWLFISFPTLINRGAGGVEKPSWAPHTPLHRAPLKETPPTLKKVNLITLYILFVMFSTPVNPGQNQITLWSSFKGKSFLFWEIIMNSILGNDCPILHCYHPFSAYIPYCHDWIPLIEPWTQLSLNNEREVGISTYKVIIKIR